MCFAPQRRALFNISSSKSAPTLVCFVHFDFEMCFAPQRRAMACTFSTSQLPKVLREWCVLYILTAKIASRHNSLQFVISHLARWLRTRRFTEPTFRPSGAPKHWKNSVFATFLPFRAPASSFLWLFLFSDLLPSSLLWLFPPLLFHLSILSEAWLLNFIRSGIFHWIFNKQNNAIKEGYGVEIVFQLNWVTDAISVGNFAVIFSRHGAMDFVNHTWLCCLSQSCFKYEHI